MSLEKKQITVGLLWHSLVSGNLGVGALTESNIAIIVALAEKNNFIVKFLVLGTGAQGLDALNNELTAAGHSLECHLARVLNKSFIAHVKRCNFVLDIGEGDSFSDIYGFKRFFYLWLSKNIVCTLRVPLILAPQTIGPFSNWFARVMAKQVMRRAHKVFARDYLSKEYLDQLAIVANVEESIDVAFRLPFKKVVFEPNGIVRVGVNVSGLLFNGGYTGNNQFGLSIDYADTITKLLTELVNLQNVEIHLVSHVIEPHMPIEDDMAVAHSLAKKFPSLIVAPHFNRPSDAKSYIAGLDYFCGARMHACVAAFSSGVPVVPMAYSRKFNGLFGSLGYPHIADCRQDSQQVVIDKILDGFNSRVQLKRDVAIGLEQVNSRLEKYENIINLLQVSYAH